MPNVNRYVSALRDVFKPTKPSGHLVRGKVVSAVRHGFRDVAKAIVGPI